MKGLETARKRAGLTQMDSAAALHVLQSTISNWENGVSNPNIDKLPALAKLYGCTMKLMTPEYFCSWCEYNGEPNGCNHPDYIGGCPAWDLAQEAADYLLEEPKEEK